MDIWNLILVSMYFGVPAYFANMAPVIAKKIHFLDITISKGLFGRNKTYRGLFFGIIFGIFGAWLQFTLFNVPFFNQFSLMRYSDWFIFGGLMGLGAIIGDLAESYLKRRLNMKEGKSFFPFDQTDFILGGFFFTFFLFWPGWTVFLMTLVVTILLHIIVNHLAYYTGIRNEKW